MNDYDFIRENEKDARDCEEAAVPTDAFDLSLAVTTAGLPAVPPVVTVDLVRPACHDCGREMTPRNAQRHPEWWLCDACLRDDAPPPDADPARAAWSDQATQSADLMFLCVFIKTHLPHVPLACTCGRNYECARCQAERIALKYLPAPAAEPQQGTDLPW